MTGEDMPTRADKDILHEFTKEEIIEWVRQNLYRRPRRSELLLIKWDRLSKRIQSLQQKHLTEDRVRGLKKRDEYARRFNASRDPEERMALLDKMRPYDKKLKEWIERGEAIEKQEEKVEAIYREYELAVEKERRR